MHSPSSVCIPHTYKTKMSTVTYDHNGYVFTLMRDVPTVYAFPEHSVTIQYASAWPSSPELVRELDGVLGKPVDFKPDDGKIYYIRALPLKGDAVLVWLSNAAEANSLVSSLEKIGVAF
jgi:hypothetical protein